jgi:starch phosphorylase
MSREQVGREMWKNYRNKMDVEGFKQSFVDHLRYTIGADHSTATDVDLYTALAYSIRDRLVDRMLATATHYSRKKVKRLYYLSLEFLMGRSLDSNLTNLNYRDTVVEALRDLGMRYDDLAAIERDAGLGNGGLGRLAACFLDSLATLGYPAYGYGLRYDFGLFSQDVKDGAQVEKPDNWMKNGNPWEVMRPHNAKTVRMYGRIVDGFDAQGEYRPKWIETQNVLGVPYDMLCVGYNTNTVNILRLWSARASESFDLKIFNHGDYSAAVSDKTESETISRVLYPSDDHEEGRELRFKQQYFFVSCTIQDILRRFQRDFGDDWSMLPEKVSIQLNDTHPSLAIPELMRILIDEKKLSWTEAWPLTEAVFAYTNHTLLPEALERWPLAFFSKILPRHLQIVFEINRRFLKQVRDAYPNDAGRISKMSIIEEGPMKQVRMANLAVVGAHKVNGVAELHSHLLQTQVMPEFAAFYPGKFTNKTNGITPRRWLMASNRRLARLITRKIGDGWQTDLDRLRGLEEFVDDTATREEFAEIKLYNKQRLARMVYERTGIAVDTASIFDSHVKRLHEYKRQLLNILHIIMLYNRLIQQPNLEIEPHTFIFGGKAAPGYHMAKLIIRLINNVAEVVNGDTRVRDKLRVAFIPNYGVTVAETIIPATDVSEQISTAGFEASGTGNMKFALNGAVTIGTLDGANVEIAEQVGDENIFIFGLTADEIVKSRDGYNPRDVYQKDAEIRAALDRIRSNDFSENHPGLFEPILNSLLDHGDFYMVLADLRAYAEAHTKLDRAYADRDNWFRSAMVNVARVGKFSSDRTIRQYADEIWKIQPQQVLMPGEGDGATKMMMRVTSKLSRAVLRGDEPTEED